MTFALHCKHWQRSARLTSPNEARSLVFSAEVRVGLLDFLDVVLMEQVFDVQASPSDGLGRLRGEY